MIYNDTWVCVGNVRFRLKDLISYNTATLKDGSGREMSAFKLELNLPGGYRSVIFYNADEHRQSLENLDRFFNVYDVMDLSGRE